MHTILEHVGEAIIVFLLLMVGIVAVASLLTQLTAL